MFFHILIGIPFVFCVLYYLYNNEEKEIVQDSNVYAYTGFVDTYKDFKDSLGRTCSEIKFTDGRVLRMIGIPDDQIDFENEVTLLIHKNRII